MWLEDQKNDVLVNWIRRTKTPMLATLPCGEILWCNEAFEGLLGFASVELVGKKTWKDLTANDEDLQNDVALAAQCELGQRTDYQLQKVYRTKGGTLRRCIIDVIRYPLNGEFRVFLVAVCPVDHGVEFALGQLNEIRELIVQMAQRENQAVVVNGLTLDKIVAFANSHPVIASVIALVLGTLLFGDRVIEIWKAVQGKVE